jgi:hypothetical protein
MGKHKYKADKGNTDIYNYYKKRTGNPHNISQGKMMEIFDKYISYVRQLMIENSFKFRMPGLGTLSFFKYKVKYRLTEEGNIDKRNLRVDWAATKKYWAELYPDKSYEEIVKIMNKPKLFHLNPHTEGNRVRLTWTRTTAIFKFKMAYSAKPLRVFTRELAKALKSNPNIDFAGFDPGLIDYSTVRKVTKERMQQCGMGSM